MILLTQRREAEAMEILDSLGGDVAAAHICRSHWGSAQARDEAYQAAIKAFCCSNRVRNTKLDSLLAEAQDKCGLDFAAQLLSGELNTLNCNPEKFPRSVPVPINGSLEQLGQPLRSTGTPTSYLSDFAISQSPTVPYLTRRSGEPKVSKLCGSAANSLAEPGEGRISLASPAVSRSQSPGVQDQPQSHSRDDLQDSCLGVLVSSGKEEPLEKSVQSPVECTEPPNIMPAEPQDLKEGIHSNLPTTSTLQDDQASKGYIHTPPVDSRSPSQSINSKSTPSSSDVPPVASSSSIDQEGDENQFFMFVVIHANEDESIACRVKDLLESMGVSNGATFCEDFLVPGHNQLTCFQDALDNSAFTLLLLTENFNSRLCNFQTNAALMRSFTNIVNSNSVIPFVPKESSLKKEDMPIMLMGIVPLNENLCVFKKTVKKTFTKSAFLTKKAAWSMKQQIRHQERLHEQYQDYRQMHQYLLGLNLQPGYNAQMPFPPMQVGFPGSCHVPLGYAPPPFLPPAFSAPRMFQPEFESSWASSPQPFAVPTSMPRGPQPHLIIQNAQMVQIGDYSQMQVERTNAALGTAEGEVDESREMEAGAGGRHGN
uniref:Uncharacterized protein n=1 Tax=Sphaerodactylus townsendi TaxID=933632 RepID=A0ACB8F1J8_9SAUR